MKKVVRETVFCEECDAVVFDKNETVREAVVFAQSQYYGGCVLCEDCLKEGLEIINNYKKNETNL